MRPGSLTLTLIDGSGTTTQTIASTSATTFFGFVATRPITSLSVMADDKDRFAEVNNLILGRNATVTGAVPEPASWAMIIAGFGLVESAMRRRGTRPALL